MRKKMNRGTLVKKSRANGKKVIHLPRVNKPEAFEIMQDLMAFARKSQELGLPMKNKPIFPGKGYRGKQYPRGQEPGCDHKKLAEMRRGK